MKASRALDVCSPAGYPVRKSIQQDVLGTRFPQLGSGNPEEPVGDSRPGQWRPCRKVLPDRSRAARDRANQKLVEYIVKAKGAESHLRAILHSRKPSRWLKTFLSSGQYVTCVETYLEDEAQLDEVVEYLQGICRDTDGEVPAHGSGDRIRFILDVLLPEVGASALTRLCTLSPVGVPGKAVAGQLTVSLCPLDRPPIHRHVALLLWLGHVHINRKINA